MTYPLPDETIKIQPIPKQLWMLRSTKAGNLIVAMDDIPGAMDDAYLVLTSYNDAVHAARHHEETYGIPCRPEMVK